MKAKKIIAGLSMLGVLMTFVGCGKQEIRDDTKENMTLKIGVLRTVDSLPIYVADDKDYFKENGVNVELVEFGSASDQSKAMESGAIDGMMTDMVVQTLLQKGGTPMRTVTVALGANISDGKFLVVSSPNSGIEKPEDAIGRTLAISEGTMMEYLVDSYFTELGIDINEVKKTNIPSLSLRFETLMADGVDMAILPEPMGDLAVAGNCNTVIDDTTLINNYSCTVVAFRKDMIDSKEAEVKAFLGGYNQAIDRINEKNEEDKEFIYSVSNVPENLRGSWSIPTYAANKLPAEEEVDRIMEWMVNKKLLDKKYEYSETVEKIK